MRTRLVAGAAAMRDDCGADAVQQEEVEQSILEAALQNGLVFKSAFNLEVQIPAIRVRHGISNDSFLFGTCAMIKFPIGCMSMRSLRPLLMQDCF